MLTVLLATLLITQVQGQKPDTADRPVAQAARRVGPLAMDGRLDEAAWGAAPVLTRFTQQQPNERAAPTERTEVRFLYDDDALYIGARMYDSRPVSRQLVRRDQLPESDRLHINIDAYHDRLHSVEFVINPSGSRYDESDGDTSWDPVWESSARVDDEGWTAEMRIPYSQLRFSRDSVQTWGLNVTRFIHRLQEVDMWAFWGQKDAGGPSYYGDLTGMRITEQPRHTELLPYVVAQTKRLNSLDARSPFYDPNTSSLRVGGDVKYRLTPSVTLSATVNPDFGQVEVDPAVVNLSAFETFFSERRPFFVEGSNVFDFGTPGCNINCGLGLALFYSRRIGRSPQGAGLAFQRGQYVDLPENTAILGALKLTGRTRGGYTFGVVNAVTGEEQARVATATGIVELPVEPMTNSFVARGKRELRGGNLTIGGIVTSVNRDTDDPGIATLLPSSAQTVGADAQLYWAKRAWSLYAAVTGSRVAGDEAAVARLQRTSARYFQRPDRDEPRFDPTATSLSGAGVIARLSKQGGTYIGDLNVASNSPGLELNDLGFFSQADWHWVNGTFGRQFTTPTNWYRSFFVMMGAEQNWNYDGVRTDGDVTGIVEWQSLNYWYASIFAMRAFDYLDDRFLRGGPLVELEGSNFVQFSVSSDARKRVQARMNVSFNDVDDGGHSTSMNANATIRPAPNVRLTIGPSYRHSASMKQYVTTIADPTATAFFGNRYVFAHIRQKQLSMNVRANVTFTPTLSLEMFMQPLIASGNYSNFEEFAAPRSGRLLIYGRDVGTIRSEDGSYIIDPDAAGPAASFTVRDPDFNFRSLRGTTVLRWEWRAGSTLFLVWTQTRSGSEAIGDFDFTRDRSALFDTPADNIFALKVSYWLGL